MLALRDNADASTLKCCLRQAMKAHRLQIIEALWSCVQFPARKEKNVWEGSHAQLLHYTDVMCDAGYCW